MSTCSGLAAYSSSSCTTCTFPATQARCSGVCLRRRVPKPREPSDGGPRRYSACWECGVLGDRETGGGAGSAARCLSGRHSLRHLVPDADIRARLHATPQRRKALSAFGGAGPATAGASAGACVWLSTLVRQCGNGGHLAGVQWRTTDACVALYGSATVQQRRTSSSRRTMLGWERATAMWRVVKPSSVRRSTSTPSPSSSCSGGAAGAAG